MYYRFSLLTVLVAGCTVAKASFPQTVELDLIFPRENETYAPIAFFPLVWGVQNPEAGVPFGIGVIWDLFGTTEANPDIILTGSIGPTINGTIAHPSLFIDSTQDINNTVSEWALVWRFTVEKNCSTQPELMIEDGWISSNQRIVFHTASDGPLPDIAGSGEDPTLCASNPIIFGIDDIVTGNDGEDCPALQHDHPPASPCAFEVDDTVASSVTAMMMETANCDVATTATPSPTADVWPNLESSCPWRPNGAAKRGPGSTVLTSIAVAAGAVGVWAWVS